MKFGFNLLLFTTFVEEEHAPLFTMLKELGYDGVEIPSGDGPPSHYPMVRKLADDAGLECTSIAMATPEADPSSEDPAIREAGFERIRDRIEVAHTLGSPVLGGPLYWAHKQFVDPPPGDDARKRAAEVLARAGDLAEQAGVTLSLEPLNRFETQLVNTTAEAMQIVEMAGHPRVAVHYDTHHAHMEEGSHEDAIALCAKAGKLAHVHFSESHRGTLGTGLVDWAAVGRGLKAANYDGWCTIESFGKAVDGLRQAANVHRDCFASREEVVQKGLAFMRETVS